LLSDNEPRHTSTASKLLYCKNPQRAVAVAFGRRIPFFHLFINTRAARALAFVLRVEDNDRSSNVRSPPMRDPALQLINALQARARRAFVWPSPAPRRMDSAVGRYISQILLRPTFHRSLAMGNPNSSCAYGPYTASHSARRTRTSLWNASTAAG
jgi:hypothetical protein